MTNTQGFDAVAEITVSALTDFVKASWKSGGSAPGTPAGPGVIPEYIDVDPTLSFGGFHVKDGKIYIPRSGLTLGAAPPDRLRVGLELQASAQLETTTTPEASLVPLHLGLEVNSVVGVLPPHVSTGPGDPDRPHDVGFLLSKLALDDLTLTYLDGDPFATHMDLLVEALAHQAYKSFLINPQMANASIPFEGQASAYSAKETLIFQDGPPPARSITVTTSGGSPPTHVTVVLPVLMFVNQIVGSPMLPELEQPIIVTSELVLGANIITVASGGFAVDLATSTLSVGAIAPAPDSTGETTAKFNFDDNVLGGTLAATLQEHILQIGQSTINLLKAAQGMQLDLPKSDTILVELKKQLHTYLTNTVGDVTVWSPAISQDVPINDVAVRVIGDPAGDLVAIAANAGPSANITALARFIPDGRSFALSLSKEGVQHILDKAKENIGGLPQTFQGDKDVKLRTLDLALDNGFIKLSGSLTVIDAILGSIDVDADFTDKVTFNWITTPDPDPAAQCKDKTVLKANPEEPDVDTKLSVLGWILSFLLGFLTFGALGLLIAFIVDKIAESTAASAGSQFTSDPDFQNLLAWPVDLPFGTVCAHFEDPIDIRTDGLTFSG